MKHLALTAIILAALFSLSSCQKGIDEIPETTEPIPPAVIQSIIESPDGKKLLLTKFEEINETYPDLSYSFQLLYNSARGLKEFKEFDENGEESGTLKVSYDNQKVIMIGTPRDQPWVDSITLKLAASGWPVSYESIEKEDSRLSYSTLETYTLNTEGYVTAENSSWIEHSDDPLVPLRKEENRYVYSYEGENLVKAEVYDKGSSTIKKVLLFEYDNNKLNLLKNFGDYDGYGFQFLFRKFSKNLLLKVETWIPDNQYQKLYLTRTANYTYTMNANGLPAEVSATETYHSSSMGPLIDLRYKMKFTYTEL
ncbi:hypothetical protein [Parasegetibacter sp. NRK P23]|uniref:hypothetical protein n=1 Tax=Parasegetibacter sp. NRK P23 TaxID=2942999 RepID=UPI0020445544|nr:hypothetical protein [Parasegetibacter sp. NRK P23]MCM5529678.1 hypothetical protein [Parasegetibacter sp. NRK P23]